MKITYFWKAINKPLKESNYISISRNKPSYCKDFKEYKDLFPSWNLIKLAHDSNYNKESFYKYKDEYFKQLELLDSSHV